MKSDLFFRLLFIPSNFQAFLGIHNQHYNPSKEPNYGALIHRYCSTGNYLKLLDEKYIRLCYGALGNEFGMNKQGAKLVPYSTFKSSILGQKLALSALSKYRLEQFKSGQKPTDDLFSKLETLFRHLHVMASGVKLVGVSKALHFLLPNLIMPVDRKNVLTFLYGSSYVPPSLDGQFKRFREVLERYSDLAQHLNLTVHNSDGKWWNVSVPKRIDNAIAGFWNGLYNGILKFSPPNSQTRV